MRMPVAEYKPTRLDRIIEYRHLMWQLQECERLGLDPDSVIYGEPIDPPEEAYINEPVDADFVYSYFLRTAFAYPDRWDELWDWYRSVFIMELPSAAENAA